MYIRSPRVRKAAASGHAQTRRIVKQVENGHGGLQMQGRPRQGCACSLDVTSACNSMCRQSRSRAMFTCPAQATRRPARSSIETDVILRWRNIAGCRSSILDAVVLCPKKCAGAGHNSQCRDCDRDKKRKPGVEESAASAILECGTLCSRASMKICNKVHATGSVVLYRSG